MKFISVQWVAGGEPPGQNAARMIPTNTAARQVPEWQRELAQAFGRPAELLAYLGLPADLPLPTPGALREFPLRVPRPYAARMKHGDPDDPLFRQVWTDPAEEAPAEGYSDDAVGDLAKLRAGGLIHKYRGRALVVTTGACAVHCRFCFRRHF